MKAVIWFFLCVLTTTTLVESSYADDLYEAIENGRIDYVRDRISSDTSLINAVNESGGTLLHSACQQGQAEIAALLIDAGANPDLADNQGMTALRWAINSQHFETAMLLLDRGAETDDKHPAYGSIMNHAFSTTCQRNGSTALVEMLIDRGLPLDGGAVDALGMTPLDWAVHFGNLPMARLALDHGADVNTVSPRLGRPPLVAAVSKGNAELAAILLMRGADVSATDNHGNSSVYYAVKEARTTILNDLIAYGAALEYTEPRTGRSLIHIAAINGHRDIAEALIANGSSIDASDSFGRAPLFYAAKYGNRSVADYLISMGAEEPDGMEANYGSSPWITDELPPNNAVAWYLNHRGWALRTQSHLLVFDAEEFGVRRPNNPCLANGFLTAHELTDQKIIGLYSCYHGLPGEPAYIHTLEDSLEEITYVHLLDDAWRGSTNTTYLAGSADTVVSGISIQTIDIADYMPMLAYMCTVDDLTIYYQAFGTDNLDSLRKRYEYLNQFVDTVDIAFMPMPESDQDQSDLRLFLDTFPTRSVLLLDPNRREYMFADAAEMMAGWGFPVRVCCAENPGDHFMLDCTR